jgi:hypothetical protein
MAINMRGSCQQVCDEVRKRLSALGLVKPQDITHGPLFDGLDKTVLITLEDYNKLRNALKQVHDASTSGSASDLALALSRAALALETTKAQ